MKLPLNNLNESPTARTELVSAGMAFAWGFSFLNPSANLLAELKTLRPLTQICDSEGAWGIVFLLVGFLLLLNALCGTLRRRLLAAQTGAFLWCFCTLTFAAAIPTAGASALLGTLIYAVHTVACASVVAHLKADVKRWKFTAKQSA